MRRIAQWCLLGVLGFGAAIACSDAFGLDDVLGVWNLTSIDGQSVPGTVTLDGDSFNIQYERLTFSEVGACAVSWQVDGDVHSFDDCDYTVDLEQKTIAVEYFGDPVFHGSVDGNRMTLTDTDDHVAVWRR